MPEAKIEEKIFYDSEKAAEHRTVTGWVDRNGHFWGEDEYMARWSGCTHRTCADCGEEYMKNSYCSPCHKKKRDAVFAKMEFQEWDGQIPLVIFDTDTYFFDPESIRDYCEDHEISEKDLPLVICEPVYPHEVDANEMFCDQLAEDGEVEDSEIIEAVEILNAAIKKTSPFCWQGGRFRTSAGTD